MASDEKFGCPKKLHFLLSADTAVHKPCRSRLLDKSTSSDAQAVHGVPTGCADEKTIVSGGHVIDLGLRRLFCSVELFFVGRWCV